MTELTPEGALAADPFLQAGGVAVVERALTRALGGRQGLSWKKGKIGGHMV